MRHRGEKRWLIGRIIAAYCAGRADARAGRRRKGNTVDGKDMAYYRQGREDERHRMKLDRRLVQIEIPFMHPADSVPEDRDADGPETVSG